MCNLISVTSFRRGVGSSNIVANLAVLLAMSGKRVGVVDINLQSPSQHILFGLEQAKRPVTFYDYLQSRCDLEQVIHEIRLPPQTDALEPIFLIPFSHKTENFQQVLNPGFDVNLLNTGLSQAAEALKLDVLLLDTQSGLNAVTMLSIALSDILVILLRPDQQDYQGTALTVQVARELEVPNILILVNEVPSVFDPAAVKAEVAHSYECEVIATLPHSDQMMILASQGIFALHYPRHVITNELKRVAASLLL